MQLTGPALLVSCVSDSRWRRGNRGQPETQTSHPQGAEGLAGVDRVHWPVGSSSSSAEAREVDAAMGQA